MPDFTPPVVLGPVRVGLATPFTLVRHKVDRNAAHSAASACPWPNNSDMDHHAAEVFPQSVASGDPSPQGAVIWTRLNPDWVIAESPVRFEISLDADGSRLLLSGEVPAHALQGENDYALAIDLEGELAENRVFYYRFIYRGVPSRRGRLRTTARTGLQPVKLAVVSCQDFTNGYYGAYRHIAQDPSIHFVLHLGDFIYDSTADRRFQNTPFADRRIQLPSGSNVALDLEDYRTVYRAVRSDPWLQQAMERHTWILTIDDHETANDVYWDAKRDTLGAPDHPYTVSPQYGNDPDLLRALKRDSQTAWMNYIPARVPWTPMAEHPFDRLRIYRSLRLGDMAELFVLDTRTYRSPHPCGERAWGQRYFAHYNKAFRNPAQTMLGKAQREWLQQGLADSSAHYKLLGNQTFMGSMQFSLFGKPVAVLNADAWDGYAVERDALAQFAKQQGIRNLVALTGDLHSYIASYLKTDYQRGNEDADAIIGVEFMTPAVSSAALMELLADATFGHTSIVDRLSAATLRHHNRHLRYFNSTHNGYSTLYLTEEYLEWTAFAVDKDVPAERVERQVLIRLKKYIDRPWLIPQLDASTEP